MGLTPNRRGLLPRAAARCLLGRRQQQVGRHAETGAQPLHHRHAQPLFPAQDFADAARSAEDRHHVGSREAVLIHQVADQVRKTRRPAGPFALLISGNQARLRLQPYNIGWIIRTPKLINERAPVRHHYRSRSITPSPHLSVPTMIIYRTWHKFPKIGRSVLPTNGGGSFRRAGSESGRSARMLFRACSMRRKKARVRSRRYSNQFSSYSK